MQEIFSYKFKNPKLLKLALTHPSVKDKPSYQKIEFLGDRVLGLVIANYLYDKFPDSSEGDLAKRHAGLVCGATISKVARRENLNDFLLLSKSEEVSGGRYNDSNLEDCLEAIIGAIYIDSKDINAVTKVIFDLWGEDLGNYISPPQDIKSRLQEIIQKKGCPPPRYKIIKTEGAAHAPEITVQVDIEGYDSITTTAGSRKLAEKELAQKMLKIVKEND